MGQRSRSSLSLPWWPPVGLSLSPAGRSQILEGGRVDTVKQIRQLRLKEMKKTVKVTRIVADLVLESWSPGSQAEVDDLVMNWSL